MLYRFDFRIMIFPRSLRAGDRIIFYFFYFLLEFNDSKSFGPIDLLNSFDFRHNHDDHDHHYYGDHHDYGDHHNRQATITHYHIVIVRL